MSLTKLSLAGNSWKIDNLFYSGGLTQCWMNNISWRSLSQDAVLFKVQGEGEEGGKKEEEEGGEENEEGSVVDWTDLREAFRREYSRPGSQRYRSQSQYFVH
jgi:hypothetical protein